VVSVSKIKYMCKRRTSGCGKSNTKRRAQKFPNLEKMTIFSKILQVFRLKKGSFSGH